MRSWIVILLAVDGAVLVALFAQLSRIEHRLSRLETRPKAKKRSKQESRKQ